MIWLNTHVERRSKTAGLKPAARKRSKSSLSEDRKPQGTRMKVKMFGRIDLGPGAFKHASNAHAFEGEINAWLGENPGIKIVDIKQSANGGGTFWAPLLCLVSIWYEEGGTSSA
jgi:hypothetical protein